MTSAAARPLRCAIYTRVSTEHGLEQEFNSLDNQREAAEAYIKSQAHEGWRCLRERYDDGGFSGETIIVRKDGLELMLEGANGAEVETAGEEAPDQDRMVLDDVQRPVLDPVP